MGSETGLGDKLVPEPPQTVELLVVKPPGLQLVKRIFIQDAQQIGSLVEGVNRLRRPELGEKISGPFENAERVWIRFTFRDGSEQVVSVSRRGWRRLATIQTTTMRLTDEDFLQNLDTFLAEDGQDA